MALPEPLDAPCSECGDTASETIGGKPFCSACGDDHELHALRDAARAALPALELLGNYIGNAWAGTVGIPPFDRCEIILGIKTALGDIPASGQYRPTRPIMTAAELGEHQESAHGRDYTQSCDGYGDMEAAEKRGWKALASWGRDGWNLGNWPYVAIYIRDLEPPEDLGRFLMQQVVEGDHTLYRFDTEDDRSAAIDYLFLWYAAGKDWAPISYDQREALDVGSPLAISDKWRGPCRV